MSLTSYLSDRSSPLRQLFEVEFPTPEKVRAAYRQAMPAGLPMQRPQPPSGIRVPPTLGAAIDHRLRYALADQPHPGGAVVGGICQLPVAIGAPDAPARAALSQAGQGLLAELTHLITQHRPAHRNRPILLPEPVEERLTRACYAASWYEEVFRSNRLSPATPMGTATADLTLEDLLATVPDYAVQDVTAVTAAAETGLAAVRANTTPAQIHPGPVFAGSRDVGGADADWIADGLLVDVKAHTNARGLETIQIYQLLGYVLLDYPNEYEINAVGWYQARCARLVAWPLPEFLDLAGARHPLTELRAHLAALAPTLTPRRPDDDPGDATLAR
jgi:hypothetical protein